MTQKSEIEFTAGSYRLPAVFDVGRAAHSAPKVAAFQKRRVTVRGRLTDTGDYAQPITRHLQPLAFQYEGSECLEAGCVSRLIQDGGHSQPLNCH